MKEWADNRVTSHRHPVAYTALVALTVAAVVLGACRAPQPSAIAGREPPPAKSQGNAQEPADPPPTVILVLPPAEPAPPPAEDYRRWLRVTGVAEGTDEGTATGSFEPDRNQIRIHTEKVTGFSIDTRRIPIDWERLVIIRINGAAAELRRRDHPVLRFERSRSGRWEVVEQ